MSCLYRFHVLPLILFFALGSPVQAAPANVDELARLSGQYVDERRPGASKSDRSDYSAAAFIADIKEQEKYLEELLAIDPDGLSLEQDIDRRLLIGITRSDINTETKQRTWENDAAIYVPSAHLGRLFEPAFAGTQAQRQERIVSLLSALPERLEQGRKNLRQPPKRFTDAAIFQTRNSIGTLEEGRPGLADLSEENAVVYDRALAALRDYLGFLENDLLARSDGSWALGREAYDFILQQRWYMDADADQILQRGRQAFAETEALAQAVAEKIQPGKPWTEVFETLKDDHPPVDGIKQAYQRQMDAAQGFVLEHQVVTLPEGERVITIDTPPAMRRSSPFGTFQSVDPYEGGLEGRLVLTPIEDWMTPEIGRAHV